MNAVDELNFRLGIGPARPRLPITLHRSGYVAVRQLGKGSFGNAYLVFHNERKQYYVVKHVNMANMSSRQRKDAHQEIAVLQQLDHPNIVRYVEFCEEHPHLYIVMEYADGGDVFTHMKHLKSSTWALGGGGAGVGEGLTEAQIISLFVQTTMAVKYMHDRRLLHRDIKSQNVFLTQSHVVKLGDFGISTVLMSTVAMAKTMCGTPCYFSPELCQGKPYNNKSDIWALGVLLYELCSTGRLPFEATSMNRLMDEICKKEPRRISPRYSDDLWNLICWMLKKDPKHRPDAGQVLHSPVLMRAIPDVVKKLSTTDNRYEKEYNRLLAPDATPPPPIRPGVEPVKKENASPDAFPSAGAAAAAALAGGGVGGGGGRLDLFRKRNEEYPFNRIRDDPVKDWLAKRQGALRVDAPRANPSGERAAYDPVLLREKKHVEELDNKSNNRPKNHHVPGVDYNGKVKDDARTVPEQEALEEKMTKGKEGDKATPKPQEGPTSRGGIPVPAIAKALRPEEAKPTPAAEKAILESKTKAVISPHQDGRVSLHELFLRYDENKKRMARDRDARRPVDELRPLGPMNYQPPKPTPPVPAGNGAGADLLWRGQQPPPPRRAVHEEKSAHVTPKVTEEKKEIMPRPIISPREPPPRKDAPADSKQREQTAEEVSPLPSNDLALVLREMTNHFESFYGGSSCGSGNSAGNAVPSAAAAAAAASATAMPGKPKEPLTTEKQPSPTPPAPRGEKNGNAKEKEPNEGIEKEKGATPSLPTTREPAPTPSKDATPSTQPVAPDAEVTDAAGPAEEFADALGTTLNVKVLQQRAEEAAGAVEDGVAEASPPRIMAAMPWMGRFAKCAPPSNGEDKPNSAGGKRRVGGGGVYAEQRDGYVLIHPSGEERASPGTTPTKSAKDEKETDATRSPEPAAEDAVFSGGCLCDAVSFAGMASAIYGSFVCNCLACSKLSGSLLGVEWLHLPDIPFEALFATDAAAIPIQSGRAAGGGAAAAQVLAKTASPINKNGVKGAEEEDKAKAQVDLPSMLTKSVVHVPMIGEDGEERAAVFVVYFCARCGSSIAMDHSEIEGSLIAKAALSDASLAILEDFQHTVLLNEESDDVPITAAHT